uniref:Uncharacterized protein n=1 Tax=Rhipicephalus zambeziensis TaxID=60191 RepID=A0A224Y5H1_9ACAR
MEGKDKCSSVHMTCSHLLLSLMRCGCHCLVLKAYFNVAIALNLHICSFFVFFISVYFIVHASLYSFLRRTFFKFLLLHIYSIFTRTFPQM